MVAFSSGNHARGVAIAARRLGIPAVIVMPVRCAAGEGRRHSRRRRRDHLLRSPHREPRGDRRQDLPRKPAPPWCRASTIRPSLPARAPSGSKSSSRWARSRRRASSCPAAAAGLASGIALALPEAEIVVVEPEGWDDMARSLELGEIVPVAADAPRHLLRCAADPARVADHLRHPARSRGDGAGGQRRGSRPKRCALPGHGMAWWSSRAALSRWPRCSRARWPRSKIRSWCCRAGMSIRRFTRGSSAALRRRCGS